MSAQNLSNNPTGTPEAPSKTLSTRKGLAGGIIMVAAGMLLLAGQFIQLGTWPILALGLIFLVAGVVSHKAGLLIPGGIIGGVGMAIIAIENNWFAVEGTPESGGVFLLIFSLGWFAITLLSKLFTNETQTWALIPGTIMAAIGGLVLMGESGVQILEFIGRYWPAVLVVIGASMLIRVWRASK